MISRFSVFAQRAHNPKAIQAEIPIGFAHGLRTSVPPSMIIPTELAECKNFMINRGGQLQTRSGLRKINTESLGKVITLASARVNNEVFKLAQTSDFKIHKIDIVTGAATLVGTAEGPADIVGFGDYAMVADGGFLKYIDDTSTLKIAWDGGSGQAATFFNNLGDTQTGQVDYTATNNAQVNFTTPSWPAGYTIALTKLQVFLSKTGTGAVPTFTVYRTYDNAVMASGSVALINIAPAPGDFADVYLTSVVPLAPSTAYYIRLTTPAYSGTNYVSWYLGTSSKPICAVSPGVPPKGSNFIVHSRRLWLYGDEDNAGTIYFNNYAAFDWSTPGQAGFVTTLDDNKTTYPVGAAMSYYGSLFIYGTKEWPYLLKLQGSSGSDFELLDLHQPLWTSPKMVTNIVNDVWALNEGGVSSITGVNMYGDVRSYSESYAIDDQIAYHWSDDAFVGYYRDTGQLWASIGEKVFVAHTKAPAAVSNYDISRVRYPWSEYTFNFTPSCFGQWGDLVVGSEEGFIYQPVETLTRDDGTVYYASLKTKYFQSPFQKLDILDIKILIDSNTGTNFDIVAFKDGASVIEVNRWTVSSALHDDTTIDDLGDTPIEDLTVAILPEATPLVQWLGFICFSYQIQIDKLYVLGSEAHVDGMVIRYRMMED